MRSSKKLELFLEIYEKPSDNAMKNAIKDLIYSLDLPLCLTEVCLNEALKIASSKQIDKRLRNDKLNVCTLTMISTLNVLFAIFKFENGNERKLSHVATRINNLHPECN